LKPAIPDDSVLFPEREPPRPELVFPDVQEDEVERILDHRKVRNQQEYVVHWLGYPDSDNAWVREIEMHTPDLLREYWARIEEKNAAQRLEKDGRGASHGNP